MDCKHCKGVFTIKKGIRNGVQQYQCKSCGKYFRASYSIRRMTTKDHRYLVDLHNWGNSLRGMSYFLKFSPSGVMKALYRLSLKVQLPVLKKGQHYQMDELRTFVARKKRRRNTGNRKKECWVAYALNAGNGEVCGLRTGSRSKKNLEPLTRKIVESLPKRVYTDGWKAYRTLIPSAQHKVYERCTNKIERYNLTIRTRVKRLGRRTLCFNRSQRMLEASLRIFFWGWTLFV